MVFNSSRASLPIFAAYGLSEFFLSDDWNSV
jgi:hypothetical protein